MFASQKILFRILTERNHRVLVVRKVGTTLRDSVFALIKDTIQTFGLTDLCNINKTDMTIHLPLFKSEILFKSIDDPEKIKSIAGITMMWFEECSELTQEDFQQLDLRLRGKTEHPKQILVTFNPISIQHWIKKVFFDRTRDDVRIIHSTYKHNKFIDDEYKKTLEALKDQDEYYYDVYVRGNWGVLGKTIFPKQIVSERIAYLRNRQPLKVGYFAFKYEHETISDIRWVDDAGGHIRLYEDVKPKMPYVLGGDTAGDGSDYFTAHVIDNSTGKQVAVVHQQFDEIDYAKQVYCLASYYNKALIGLEVNYSSYPTRKLEEWNYPKMYMREVQDTFTHQLQKKFGFLTGKITRPLIIAELVTIVKESVHLINDIPTLEEMLTFVKNENGRPEAQAGAHDDLLMGLAITYHIRDQQTMRIEDSYSVDISKLPQDLQDDYNRASAEDKKRMAAKWGIAKG